MIRTRRLDLFAPMICECGHDLVKGDQYWKSGGATFFCISCAREKGFVV